MASAAQAGPARQKRFAVKTGVPLLRLLAPQQRRRMAFKTGVAKQTPVVGTQQQRRGRTQAAMQPPRVATKRAIVGKRRGRVFCGRAAVLPAGKRRGTPTECFVLGLLTGRAGGGGTRRAAVGRKPPTGLRSLPGIGEMFERRLQTDFGITTVTQLEDRLRRQRGAKQRKELLKKILRGFRSRKVNRRSFAKLRDYLQTRGIPVENMTKP